LDGARPEITGNIKVSIDIDPQSFFDGGLAD